MFVARRNCLKEKWEYGGTLHQKPNIWELYNDDGDAEDDAVSKSIYILPSNVATVFICSVHLLVRKLAQANRVCARDVIKFSNPKLMSH